MESQENKYPESKNSKHAVLYHCIQESFQEEIYVNNMPKKKRCAIFHLFHVFDLQ